MSVAIPDFANEPDAVGDHDPHRAAMPLDAVRPLPRISIQAFCESDALAATIDAMGRDRRMAKTQMKVHTGGVTAAAEHFANAPTPNLVILETRLPPGELVDTLDALADVCDPGSRVVVVGHYNDVTLYRDLMRRGISEYLVAPVAMHDLLTVVSGLYDDGSEPLGRTVAFVGAKGGVGSSTVAHNVAWSIAHLFETEVVLADLDLAFGTANINFDQDPPQGIADALFADQRMDDALLDRLLTRCADNLSLLAAPSVLERTYDFSHQSFAHIIETAQKSMPVVVLDVPHAWNDWTRGVLAGADRIVLTATPDLANLRNAKNLIDTLQKLRPNDPKPELLLNQTQMPKRPEIAISEFLEPLGYEEVASIAFDPQAFGNAANNGQMIGEVDARHASVAAFEAIAHSVTGRMVARPRRKAGLFDRLRRK